MDVVFRATDCERHALEFACDAAKISVQVIAPVLRDHGHAILGTENKMIVKAKVS